MAIDRIKQSSRGKHRGEYFSCWLSEEQNEKLTALAESSGLSKSAVMRALLDGKHPPDQSYWKMYSQLASLGGLIKYLFAKGKRGEAWELGEELVACARALERQQYLEAEKRGEQLLKKYGSRNDKTNKK